MPDIQDGQTVTVQGSGTNSYVLKNTGGVYSCTCAAWRNQSVGIERRTCKHLRKYRGDAAEESRLGGALPTKPAKVKANKDGTDAGGSASEPALLLAEAWDHALDLAGWWMSEKLDGVRAYWDGQQFLSRQGNLYHAPDWFIAGLPNVPLDGELWLDRKAFQRTVSIVRRQDKGEQWRAIRYLVFDAPAASGTFEDRLAFLKDGEHAWRNEFAKVHEQLQCRNVDHLRAELQRVESLGGEGLMLREPGSMYVAGRSATLLKVKTFHDAEAVVVGHEAGKGRHAGRLGALTVQLANGKQFSVGTGFTDRQRTTPPPVGSLITFRYQELSDAGIPRFPSYVGLRTDVEANSASSPPPESSPTELPPPAATPAVQVVSSTTSEATLPGSRLFENREGKSSKFWEINVDGQRLTTRWGRIGSQGQSKTRQFASPELAWAERDASIAAKLASGYREVAAAAPSDLLLDLQSMLEERLGLVDDPGVAPESASDQDKPPSPAIPSDSVPAEYQIHLSVDTSPEYTNQEMVDGLDSELVADGYHRIGDFIVQELPVRMRIYWQAPNMIAVVSELMHMVWVELSLCNEDETLETWTNVPMHDGLSPPWSQVVVQPRASLQVLQDLMRRGSSGKPPAVIDPNSIVQFFEENYAKIMAWRAQQAAAGSSQSAGGVDQGIADLVWAYAREYSRTPYRYGFAPDALVSGRAILRLEPEMQAEVLRACYVLREAIIDETRYDLTEELRQHLLKSQLPFSDAGIEFLADQLVNQSRSGKGVDPQVLGALEHWAKSHSLSADACTKLRIARENTVPSSMVRDAEKQKARIDVLIGDDAVRIPLSPTEVWALAATEDLESLPAPARAAWIRLFRHGVTVPSGKPTAAWNRTARECVDAISIELLREFLLKWFPLVDRPWPKRRLPEHLPANDPLAIAESNQDILKGLVWCCTVYPDSRLTREIGSLAVSAYRKIPQLGARAVRVGNACVYGLGVIGDADAVAQLAMLKLKVKSGTAQRFIDGELEKAATRLGLAREDLEEMSVPTFGMEEVGLRRESLGGFTAELRVDDSGEARLQWFKADGSPQKSVPASIQKQFEEDWKELKATAKDLGKMLSAQRDRLDGLALRRTGWPYAVWRDRYLDHPLVGTLARRLIWRFRQGSVESSGIFHRGKLVDYHDGELPLTGDDTRVELWHPIGLPLPEVLAWREWLERHEIRQPFKQAHREVYLLTDAEKRTGTYSNRFAAHVLRQSQCRALASTRGWQAPLLGYWDGGDASQVTRQLPAWNLTAEFWILGIPPGAENEELAPSAGMPFIGSDQVRFRRCDESEPIPLDEVPALVFSEIMRDVDLLVGVASVGNDPNWADGGPNHQFLDYWRSYSFGDLSATAKTRRDVLERLLPRLRIASRCKLGERFLEVRGDLRSYKIHLGSGNILMSPNDQYLCIVPKPTNDAGGQVFLPFDGDRMFSIILSKAFLLADDAKIKDPSITHQIRT